MASIELDPSMKQALRHLHSSARDSTEQVRLLLDEILRQTAGSSKTMASVLPKKYLLEERNDNYPKHKFKGDASKSSGVKTVAPPTQSPQQLRIPEREESEEDSSMLGFDLLEEDLTCAVCRQIAVQAGNRLVECDVCHALYHQDCHKPVISENDVGAGWQCGACLLAHSMSAGSSKSGHSSPTLKSSGKHSQSSGNTKVTIPTTSGSSKVVTPTINIISADKRLQIMKKKAAKQHENKRKHSK